GKPTWAIGIGGFGDDTVRGVAVGADGSTSVCGMFEGEIIIGDQKYPANGGKGTDAFLVKLDPAGKVVWSKTWGAKRDDVAMGLAVRGDAVVVVGHFLDTLTIGEFTKKSAGSDDMFVAAFDGKGEAQWLWTGGGFDSDGLNTIEATPDGGWIVGGSFTDAFDLGAIHLKAKGKTAKTDAVLIKLKAGGDTDWVKTFGGNYDDTILHLAVDANGNIIVQGHLQDVSDWGGAPLTAGGGSDNDVVLAKYDANGEHRWSHNYGNAFNDVAGGVAVDASGAITMVGSFDKTITFGKTDSHTALGESDIFIARYSAEGVLEWAKTYGADREDQAFGVAVDRFGASVLTGYFTGDVDFGKGVVKSNTPNKDVVVMKHDAKGAVVWVRTFGDHDHDHGRGVAMDDKGNATIIGTFRFTLDLGIPTIPVVDSMRMPDDKIPRMDTFVLRLAK
ncbi:MAG: hypothetical protein NT062_12970, partial [Proteobacteria bacterium]|nr:hypothetical protein [Pseudomonadota bacterium]